MRPILGPLRTIAIVFAVLAALVVAGLFGPVAFQVMQNQYWPATIKWTPTRITVIGKDLLVEGTQVKARNCKYLSPPRAFGKDGKPLLVESLSKTAGQNWPASPTPRPFGPWLVIDGASQPTTLLHEHQCHTGIVWSTLGVIADGKKQ